MRSERAAGEAQYQAALADVFAQWRTRDTASAQAWLDSLADPHLRSSLLEQNALRDLGHPQLNLPFFFF